MATVTLGNIKFNWKGAWNSGTAYVIDDVVSLSGSSYVSIQAGTNQNPASASAYWQQMSAAGTNGTDLTSTLTTQGDIVYRDGSGLQRLGYGTAGQVLQTGGSGANPSWGTVSSDFVKLATGTIGNVGSVAIDGYYTSDYDNYKLIITNIRNDTASRQLYWRFRASNTSLTAGNYRYTDTYTYNNSSNSRTTGSNGGWGANQFANGWDLSTGSDRGAHLQMMIYEPLKTGTNKHIQYEYLVDVSDATYLATAHGGGYYNGSSGAHSGIELFPQANSFNTGGKWKLYGIKA